MTATIQIFAADAVHAAKHAAALGRLQVPATVHEWGDTVPELALVDAALLGGTALGDLRREAPFSRLVVAFKNATLDDAAQMIGMPNVAFLSRPCHDADYALALAMILHAGAPATAAAEGDAGYALRLAALGEEIARIARAIEPPLASAGAPPAPEAPLAFDPAAVRAVLKARRLRDSLFPAGTFADPAWDMLLDLTASRGEGARVSVTSLAIAAAVPPTTALRHLKAMADAGLVVRRSDPDDGRRTYIDLSEDAFARMRAWVAGAAKTV